MKISQQTTNELLVRIEKRQYGRELQPEELAQKAGVGLDYVTRIENQYPIEDPVIWHRLAEALGISMALLRQIAGQEQMSPEELRDLEECLADPQGKAPTCQRIGLRDVA